MVRSAWLLLALFILIAGCGGEPVSTPDVETPDVEVPDEEVPDEEVPDEEIPDNGPPSFTPTYITRGNQPGFCKVDGRLESVYQGYSGREYINTDNRDGARIVWHLEATAEGEHTAQFRYANGDIAPAGVELYVNDVLSEYILFESTTAWNQWQTVLATAYLSVGSNKIELIAKGPAGVPNIDYFAVEAVSGDITAGDCSVARTVGEKIWRGEYRTGLDGCNSCHNTVRANTVDGVRAAFSRVRAMNGFLSFSGDEVQSVIDYVTAQRN